MADRIERLTQRALRIVDSILNPAERRDQARRNAEREAHAAELRVAISALSDEARSNESYSMSVEGEVTALVDELDSLRRQLSPPSASSGAAAAASSGSHTAYPTALTPEDSAAALAAANARAAAAYAGPPAAAAQD